MNGKYKTAISEMPSRQRDQEERLEELSSPGALRDCKEECKLSWWGEDRKSKQDLPGKLGCRFRVEEKGLILRSGNLSEGTGKGDVCSSESVSKCKINANQRSEICHLPVPQDLPYQCICTKPHPACCCHRHFIIPNGLGWEGILGRSEPKTRQRTSNTVVFISPKFSWQRKFSFN